MQWSDLLAALALVLIIEGLLPFANPDGARRLYAQMASASSQLLRGVGLVSIVTGMVVLYLAR